MSDFEALEIVFDPPSYEVCAIIRDDGVRDPIPSDNVVPDEFFRRRGCDSLVGGCFHSLGKVVDRYKNKAMIVGGCWMYSANDVNPPSGERPWRRHAMELLWGSMDKIPMDLTVVTSAHKLAAICLHG